MFSLHVHHNKSKTTIPWNKAMLYFGAKCINMLPALVTIHPVLLGHELVLGLLLEKRHGPLGKAEEPKELLPRSTGQKSARVCLCCQCWGCVSSCS